MGEGRRTTVDDYRSYDTLGDIVAIAGPRLIAPGVRPVFHAVELLIDDYAERLPSVVTRCDRPVSSVSVRDIAIAMSHAEKFATPCKQCFIVDRNREPLVAIRSLLRKAGL